MPSDPAAPMRPRDDGGAVGDPLAPHAGERRLAAFDVRIYAGPPVPDLPECIATSYRAVVRGVETGTVAESTSPVGTWALLRAIRDGARQVRDLNQESRS